MRPSLEFKWSPALGLAPALALALLANAPPQREALTPKSRTMNCEVRSAADFHETMAFEAMEARYVPPADPDQRWDAHFELIGFGDPDPRVRVILASDEAGGVIYDGPLVSSLVVPARLGFERMIGQDQFRILLVDEGAKTICVAQHSDEFWQRGQVVQIRLLEQRIWGDNGLPVDIEVSARPSPNTQGLPDHGSGIGASREAGDALSIGAADGGATSQ